MVYVCIYIYIYIYYIYIHIWIDRYFMVYYGMLKGAHLASPQYFNSCSLMFMVYKIICLNHTWHYRYVWSHTQDDVMKCKHFPRYWPFVRGIHRSPVNSPHNGQWRGALIFSLICVWINGWVNNRQAGDWRRHRAHYDVTVMYSTGI